MNNVLELVVERVCVASLALATTVFRAVSTTSLVLLPNPNSPCHVFPSASRTATVLDSTS